MNEENGIYVPFKALLGYIGTSSSLGMKRRMSGNIDTCITIIENK